MKKKILISCLFFLLILFIYSSLFPHTLRIFGKNRLTLWQWKDTSETSEHFFEDILTTNFIYGSFRGNIEWYIYEPSEVKFPLRHEGIRKRFLEFNKQEWSIRAGNFYHSFGRGLILNQTVETIGNIDRDIDGFFFDYTIKSLYISLLSGKPKNVHFTNKQYFVPNDTFDILQAGNISLSLFPLLPFSLNFLRLSSENPGVKIPRETYLYSFDINVVKGPFMIYTEIAKREGWNNILFTESEGIGLYGSLTLFVSRISASFEYLFYDSLGYGGSDYRYNAPPTGNLDNYSINRASDEKGWMIDITSNPFENWYLQLNKSTLSAISSDSLGFDEIYGELKGDLWTKGPTILLSLKNLDYKKPEPDVDRKTEWIPQIGFMSYLKPLSLSLGLNSRIVEIDSLGIKIIKFMDNGVSLDMGIFSYLTLSGRWEIRDKEVLLESVGTEWKVIELRWDISDSHTLNIMAGSEKGGLICSGGYCRIEEPFEGIKVNLLSRF